MPPSPLDKRNNININCRNCGDNVDSVQSTLTAPSNSVVEYPLSALSTSLSSMTMSSRKLNSPMSIDDAYRWNGYANDSYNSPNTNINKNTNKNNDVAMISNSNNSSYARSTTTNNRNDGSKCSINRNSNSCSANNKKCDVVDSDFQRNNKYNTDYIDWKYSSGNVVGDSTTNNNNNKHINISVANKNNIENIGLTTTHNTVINYWLRNISNELITSMKTVINTNDECAMNKNTTTRTTITRTPTTATTTKLNTMSRIPPRWKSIISIVIYTLLVTAMTRHCDAHKHEGTLLITLYHFINLIRT